MSDIGNDQVTRVTLHLIYRQVGSRLNKGWQRHLQLQSVWGNSLGVNRVVAAGIPRHVTARPCPVYHLTEQPRDKLRTLHLGHVTRLRQHHHGSVAERAPRRSGEPGVHQPVAAAERDERGHS